MIERLPTYPFPSICAPARSVQIHQSLHPTRKQHHQNLSHNSQKRHYCITFIDYFVSIYQTNSISSPWRKESPLQHFVLHPNELVEATMRRSCRLRLLPRCFDRQRQRLLLEAFVKLLACHLRRNCCERHRRVAVSLPVPSVEIVLFHRADE